RLILDSNQVRNETTIDVQRVSGRLDEIEIEIPHQLQLVSVGPPELVESATPKSEVDQVGKEQRTNQSQRALKIALTPLGRDQKSFSLDLRGEQRIGPEAEVKLGLFSPRGSVSTSSSFTIVAPRDLTFELTNESGQQDPSSAPVFRVQRPEERS